MVGQSPKVIGITNSTNFISTIGNHWRLGEILEDVRLASYESWGEMEQCKNEGSRDLFL